MHIQLTVATVVNNWFYWSVGLYMYISIRTPGGSCPPPPCEAYMCQHRCIMRRLRNICSAYRHYARQNSSISAGFRLFGNCYGISCHRKGTVNSSDAQNMGNVAMPMHKIPYPLWGWWLIAKSHLGLVTKASHSSAQVFRNNKLFLQSHGTAGAEDHMWSSNPKL